MVKVFEMGFGSARSAAVLTGALRPLGHSAEGLSKMKLGIILAIVVGLAGCHPIRALRSRELSCHSKQPYMAATSVAPLKIPAGLDTPDTTNALHIPPLNEPAPPVRKGKEPCLDEAPPFKVPPKPAPPQA